MGVKEVMDTDIGSIMVSIILGLGLAAVFRRACKDNRCIVIKGPKVEEVQKYTYKVDDQCYKYVPQVTSCSFNPDK